MRATYGRPIDVRLQESIQFSLRLYEFTTRSDSSITRLVSVLVCLSVCPSLCRCVSRSFSVESCSSSGEIFFLRFRHCPTFPSTHRFACFACFLLCFRAMPHIIIHSTFSPRSLYIRKLDDDWTGRGLACEVLMRAC